MIKAIALALILHKVLGYKIEMTDDYHLLSNPGSPVSEASLRSIATALPSNDVLKRYTLKEVVGRSCNSVTFKVLKDENLADDSMPKEAFLEVIK